MFYVKRDGKTVVRASTTREGFVTSEGEHFPESESAYLYAVPPGANLMLRRREDGVLEYNPSAHKGGGSWESLKRDSHDGP